MKMYDLSDEDVKRIVDDIFSPTKITNIRRNKKTDTVSCTIYTEWEGKDEDGKKETDIIADRVTFRNPFDYGPDDAIEFEDPNFPVDQKDLKTLMQFCYAKGIQPEYLKKDNPYLVDKKQVVSPTKEPVGTKEAIKLLYSEYKAKVQQEDVDPRLLIAYQVAVKSLEEIGKEATSSTDRTALLQEIKEKVTDISVVDMFQDFNLKTPQVMKAEFLGILTEMLKENKAFEKDTETDQEEEEEEKEI